MNKPMSEYRYRVIDAHGVEQKRTDSLDVAEAMQRRIKKWLQLESIIIDKDSDMKTVHVLEAGFSLCMFSTNAPDNWPEDNIWIDLVLFKQGGWEGVVTWKFGDCKLCERCKELGDEIVTDQLSSV